MRSGYSSPVDEAWLAMRAKQYEEGLTHILRIKAPPDDNVFLIKGRCYQGLKMHTQALACFKEIQFPKIRFLSLAHCYEAMNHYDAAIKNFQKINHWNKDKKTLLSLARCYQKKGHFDAAIDNYNLITHWKRDKRVLLGLARCYQQMGHYDGAIHEYQMIPEWTSDKQALLGLARCYQEMGHYDTSINTFKLIDNWKNDKQAFLGLALCYQKRGQYSAAFNSYHAMAPWRDDIETLLNLARCYMEIGHYDTAIRTLKKIGNWNNDKKTLLSLALCYEWMGNYDSAINLYHKMILSEGNKKALLSLARCYQAMGNYNASINTFYLIYSWENDKQALLGLAICYQDMGNYDKAMTTLYQIYNWKNDKQALLGLASCYQKMGYYKQAISRCHAMPRWEKDKEILLCLACCYMEMGQYDESLKMLHRIYDWKSDKQTLLSLAHCYQKMGQYDSSIITYRMMTRLESNKLALLGLAYCYQEAGDYDRSIMTFHQIYNWKKDKQTLLALSLCYQNMGCFYTSIIYLKQINNWEKDKRALLRLALCYQEVGHYDASLNTYRQIYHWEHDKEALLGLAHCCHRMKRYNECFEFLNQIYDWRNDKDALLGLAYCYQMKGENQQAQKTYIELTSKFPNDANALYAYCLFLFEAKISSAETILEQAWKKWPYHQSLYLLNANYIAEYLNPIHAIRFLSILKIKFPYDTHIYFNLVRYHYLLAQPDRANEIAFECKKKFSGFIKFFKMLDQLHYTYSLKDYLRLIQMNSRLPHPVQTKKISLPDTIQLLFSTVNALPGEHYLCGSQVIKLVQAQYNQENGKESKEVKSGDFDFVSSCTDEAALLKNAFQRSHHLPQLYTRKIVPFGFIDLYTVNVQEEKSESWIQSNALSRDFTICAVFVDVYGQLKDPTGYGLMDIQNKYLRIIGDPATRLQQDPVRILRAIKYMVLGFRPSADLEQALLEWKPTNGLDQDHIKSVVSKHMKQLSPKQLEMYMNQLAHYGLLIKLFKISNEAGVDSALNKLKSNISFNEKYKVQPYTQNAGLLFKGLSQYGEPVGSVKKINASNKIIQALDLALTIRR